MQKPALNNNGGDHADRSKQLSVPGSVIIINEASQIGLAEIETLLNEAWLINEDKGVAYG